MNNMQIFFELDQSEEIDPIDPLGKLMLTDGKTVLFIENTYLDSWFTIFIDALKALNLQNKLTVEIEEEPELITFEKLAKGFKINYLNKELFCENIDTFSQVLTKSAQQFLDQLCAVNNNVLNFPNLIKINNFINEKPLIHFF
jgi:hypothetical protein